MTAFTDKDEAPPRGGESSLTETSLGRRTGRFGAAKEKQPGAFGVPNGSGCATVWK